MDDDAFEFNLDKPADTQTTNEQRGKCVNNTFSRVTVTLNKKEVNLESIPVLYWYW